MSPYDKSIIVSVFVRKAQRQANPADFLINLQDGNFQIVADLTKDAAVLTATSTGGSSVNFILPPNMSRMDIMEISELALRNIETGIDAPLQLDANGNPIPNQIKQVPPSQRLTSYALFGNIQL